jgi:putative chitinase
MIIRPDQLNKLFPRAKPGVVQALAYGDATFKKFEIDTLKRIRHFLAQMAHESVGFRYLYELGGKSYFRRYEGRKDLGNTQPGDGYKYRGRGIIQLTGRYNYDLYGKKLGIDLLNNPKLAARPDVALQVACQYWKDKNLNAYADRGDIRTITKRINGGYNGFKDRIRWLNKIKKVI